MASKITFFFKMGNWGWSESYYNLAEITNPLAASRATTLLSFRKNALPSAASHVGTRISNPAVRGAVNLLPGTGAGAATWSSTVDWGFTSILFREKTVAASITGKVFLRPGPETPFGAEVPDADLIPTAVLFSLGSFRLQLEDPANEWVVRGISTLRPTVAIKGLSATGTLGTVTTFGAHLVLVGEKFRISRVVNPSGRCFNGVFRAESAPTSDTITFTIGGSGTVALGSGGFLRGQLLAFEQIRSTDVVRIVSHRTGRPFGLPRGRRSNRTLCCPVPVP